MRDIYPSPAPPVHEWQPGDLILSICHDYVEEPWLAYVYRVALVARDVAGELVLLGRLAGVGQGVTGRGTPTDLSPREASRYAPYHGSRAGLIRRFGSAITDFLYQKDEMFGTFPEVIDSGVGVEQWIWLGPSGRISFDHASALERWLQGSAFAMSLSSVIAAWWADHPERWATEGRPEEEYFADDGEERDDDED